MLYREIVFMIKDLLKINSNESYYEEEHIIYLLHQERMMALKQRYSDVRRNIPDVNFQTIALNMSPYLVNQGGIIRPNPGTVLRSISGQNNVGVYGDGRVPSIINVNSVPSTTTRVRNYTTGELYSFISFDRLHYTGYNAWLANMVYCALGTGQDSGYLFLKSANANYLNITRVMLTSLFENPLDAYKIDISIGQTRPLDYVFPLESPLVPQIIDRVLRQLLGANYRPIDNLNNSSDDVSTLVNFIRQNLKNPLTKAIENE